jgi:hypothetical protein
MKRQTIQSSLFQGMPQVETKVISRREDFETLFDGFVEMRAISYNEYITSIVPLEARLKFKKSTEPVINIRSKNLRETLEIFGNPSISSAVLAHIKLRFTLAVDGKEDKVTFVITPPYATDLVKKMHSKIITEYLKENKVQG